MLRTVDSWKERTPGRRIELNKRKKKLARKHTNTSEKDCEEGRESERLQDEGETGWRSSDTSTTLSRTSQL
jgi:hypothetical protein